MERPVRYLTAFAAALFTLAAAQQSPITFTSEINIVSEVTNPDGSVTEVLTPATNAIPGQVVEFRIHATNSGPDALPANRVQISGPIQVGMEYVEGSATPSSDRITTVLTGEGVRWTLLEPMEAGQTEEFVYRVRIVPAEPAARDGAAFQILSVSYRWEGSYLYVVGEVRNTSRSAMGVELQATARDANGRLVDVATFWPASVGNIPAGGTYGFRYPVTQQRSAVHVDVKVVGSNVWR